MKFFIFFYFSFGEILHVEVNTMKNNNILYSEKNIDTSNVEAMLALGRKFFQLHKEDKKTIMCHADTDGIVPAAVLAKFYPVHQVIIEKLPLSPDSLRATVRAAVSGHVLIGLDLALHQYRPYLDAIRKIAPVICCDHHAIEGDKEYALREFGYINPALYDYAKPWEYCTSKIVFDILHSAALDGIEYCLFYDSDFVELLKKEKWKIALGIICDVADKKWRDFMTEIFAEYSESDLRKLERLLTLYCHCSETPEVALRALILAEHPSDVLEGRNIYSYILLREYPVMEQEFKTAMSMFEEKAESPEDGIVFYEIESDYAIASKVATEKGKEFEMKRKDVTLFVLQRSKKEGGVQKVKVKGRDHSGRLNLARLMKEAAEKLDPKGKADMSCEEIYSGCQDKENVKACYAAIDQVCSGIGKGGGHVVAAAGEFPAAALDEFKKFAVHFVKENKKGFSPLETMVEEYIARGYSPQR